MSGSNSDFMFAVPSAAGVRLIIGTQHRARLTLFSDEQDSGATLRIVVERASPAVEGGHGSWEFAPFGSDRFIGFTEADGGVRTTLPPIS